MTLMRKINFVAWLCSLAMAGTLLAQQPETRGENVRGTIKSIDEKSIVVNDGSSDITIVLTEQSRYRRVNETTKDFVDVRRADVTAGAWASVSNNRRDGQINARYVFFASSKDQLDDAWAKLHAARAAAAATKPAAVATAPATRPTTAPTDPTIPAPKTGERAAMFMDLHRQFLERTKQGPIEVLFLGDSITRGWATRGRTIWDQRYEPLKAANFGIGGDRTENVLWRIENGELEAISPKVVVLMIGTNNTGNNKPEAIARGIELIVQRIRSKCPASKILLLGVFPRTRPNEEARVESITTINSAIAKLDDGKTIRYLDLTAKFLGPDGKVPVEIMPDGLHPNEAGYQIWADAMQPLLDEMLK